MATVLYFYPMIDRFKTNLSKSIDIGWTMNAIRIIFMIWISPILLIIGVIISMKFSIIPDAL